MFPNSINNDPYFDVRDVKKPPDESLETRFFVIFVPLFILATIFVYLRFHVRKSINAVGKDDYLMLMSWIFYAAAFGLFTAMMTVGECGRHTFYVTLEQAALCNQISWYSAAMIITAQTVGKISIGFVLLKILGPQARFIKHFLWANLGFFTALCIAAVIVLFVQCKPISGLWGNPLAKCWDPRIFLYLYYVQSAFGSWVDFLLATIPIKLFWNLKLNVWKKVILCSFMSLGYFTGIASIFKTYEIHNLTNTTDPNWACWTFLVWLEVEQTLIIICGTIPTLKPLFNRCVNKANRLSWTVRSSMKDFFKSAETHGTIVEHIYAAPGGEGRGHPADAVSLKDVGGLVEVQTPPRVITFKSPSMGNNKMSVITERDSLDVAMNATSTSTVQRRASFVNPQVFDTGNPE